MKNQLLVLFDGDCAFCNAAVHFIIKHDPKGRFCFATLHSSHAEMLFLQNPQLRQVDSLILVDEKQFYIYSTAALKIGRELSGFWRISYFLICIPKSWRDTLYRFIAKHRMYLKKKNTVCYMPSSEEEKRFLL